MSKKFGDKKSILLALSVKKETVVFAESCTAGAVSAEFAKTPGASEALLGSFVTYSPKMKRKLLGVKKKTIKKHTCESAEVVTEMALGALRVAKSNWAVAVVGHFGPDAPEEKDGMIWVAMAFRGNGTKSATWIDVEYVELEATGRVARCSESVKHVLARFQHAAWVHDFADWTCLSLKDKK